MVIDGDWEVTLRQIDEVPELQAVWEDLEKRSRGSVFQSWIWLGTWLSVLGGRARILVLECRRDGVPVGLGLLGESVVRRHRVMSSRSLSVSETGNPEFDAITVEHNGLLAQRGLEDEVVARCVAYLQTLRGRWDDFVISGLEERASQAYIEAASRSGLAPAIIDERPYYFVDLALLRAAGKPHLRTVSGNARYQIRRARRLYEARGAVSIEPAADLRQAQDYFQRMCDLHQQSWICRGERGAFANAFITEFHRRLITDHFESGAVQLLCASAAGEAFGYLYNLVYRGVVSNYQSGFAYETNSQLKPGLLSHNLAIDMNIERHAQVYDFLAGDQRFKRSLATHERWMRWMVAQRPRFTIGLESGLRALFRRH